jgi:protein gp37
MDTTTIEWVIAVARSRGMDARVWNAVRGCRPVSDGCMHCWAARVADTRSKHPNAAIRARHEGLTTRNAEGKPVFNGTVRLIEDGLTIPLRTKRSSVWFAPSEGDLFAEGVTDEMRDRVFAVMALAPRHIFQVLTKRPERMREYLSADDTWLRICKATIPLAVGDLRWSNPAGTDGWWPLPNVWLGVSVENQAAADERIPHLLATPAAVRFLSCEPLLGPVDLRCSCHIAQGYSEGAHEAAEHLDLLHWVIAGGESGPKARPMHPDWVRSLRDQCAAAGVPILFKQWGEYLPWSQHGPKTGVLTCDQVYCEMDFSRDNQVHEWPDGDDGAYRLGKSAAGRLLDGVEHNAVPEVRLG